MPPQERRTNFTKPRASVLAAIVATLVFAVAVFAVSPTAPASAQEAAQITSDGIGNAVIGSSRNQLAAQLGPSYTFGPAEPVLVDVEGYEVRRNGVVQFIAATSYPIGPDVPLSLFLVREPGLTTPEGIGVGSTIAEGVAAYGPVQIILHTDNEGREYAEFESQPRGIFFRTGSGRTAGTYDEQTETAGYRADAEIQSVVITCISPSNPCPPQPTLPETGATQTALLLVSIGLASVGFALVYVENRLAKK